MIITILILAAVAVPIIGVTAIAIGNRIYSYWDNKAMSRVRELTQSGTHYTEDKLYNQYLKRKNKFNWAYYSQTDAWIVGLFITLAIALFNGVIFLGLRGPSMIDKKYNNLMEERRILELRLNSKAEIGNEFLYNDIVTFNEKIRDYKADRKNPWISWYCSEKICTIDEIELTEEDMYSERDN